MVKEEDSISLLEEQMSEQQREYVAHMQGAQIITEDQIMQLKPIPRKNQADGATILKGEEN